MGLKSAFDLELSAIDQTTLTRLRKMTIQQLGAACKSHKHPWHTGVVASVQQSSPRLRTVVLRAATDSPLKLRFHTDYRSAKVAELEENSAISWLFYEPSTRIQLRVDATASVLKDGELFSEAWERTSLPSRRCYLGPHPPGAVTEGLSNNLPEHLLDRDPTTEESEPGQANFAIVQCIVNSMDWLYLKHSGHLRCKFDLMGDEWTENWLAP